MTARESFWKRHKTRVLLGAWIVGLVAAIVVMVVTGSRDWGAEVAVISIVWSLLVLAAWVLPYEKISSEFWLLLPFAAGTLALFLIVRRHELASLPSVGFVLIWLVFFFALGLLVSGDSKFDLLTNQVGLALVTGLVLALAAFVVNLVLEDAFENRDRARREAETKLAINQRDQWIFRSEDMIGFDLSGMSLTRSIDQDPFDFSFANMTGVNLENADLRGAVLQRSLLVEASMAGANLAGAELSSATLDNAQLPGANLVGARLVGASLSEAKLDGADLSHADLTGAGMQGVELRAFAATAEVGGSPAAATLLRADGNNERSQPAMLVGAKLIGADLTDAKLIGADLTGADLTDAVLDRADLSGAILTDATVRPEQLASVEAMTVATICPSGVPASADDPNEWPTCEGQTGRPTDPDESVDASFLVDPGALAGTPIGRATAGAAESDGLAFAMTSICRHPKAPAGGECELLEREDWPVSVDTVSGVIRTTEAMEADATYRATVGFGLLTEDGAVSAESLVMCEQEPEEGEDLSKTGQEPCMMMFEVKVKGLQESEAGIEFFVRSDAEIGSPVGLIDIEDAVLTTGADVFHIDGDELQVNGVLEAGTRYDVAVQSRDVSDSPTVRMVIVVLPPNDPPEVAPLQRPIGMSAAAQPGEVVTVVDATDPNPNDVLSFAITAIGRTSGTCGAPQASFVPVDPAEYAFSMEPADGTVLVRQPLDEGVACYRLTIEVSDNAVVSLSRRTEVQVSVGE